MMKNSSSGFGSFPSVTKKLPPASNAPTSPPSNSPFKPLEPPLAAASPLFAGRQQPPSINQLLAKSKENGSGKLGAAYLAPVKQGDLGASGGDANGRLSRSSSGAEVQGVHFFEEGPSDEPQAFAANPGDPVAAAPPEIVLPGAVPSASHNPKQLLRTTSSMRVITLDENDVPHDSRHPAMRQMPSVARLMSFIEEFNPADAIREICERMTKAEAEVLALKAAAARSPGLQSVVDQLRLERDKLRHDYDDLKDDLHSLERDLEQEKQLSAEKDKRFTDLELAFLLQKEESAKGAAQSKQKLGLDPEQQKRFEEVIAELRRQVDAKNDEIKQLLEQVSGKDHEILEQQKQLVRKNEEVLALQNRINALEAELVRTEKRLVDFGYEEARGGAARAADKAPFEMPRGDASKGSEAPRK